MRIKRSVWTVLLALAFVALQGGLLLLARPLVREYDGVGLRLSDTGISGKKLKRLMEQGDDGLFLTAAWSWGKPVAIGGKGLATSAEARLVTAYGDIRRIAPMRLVSGGYPVEEDANGCLLTSDVAMALFHSVDAEGARVLAGGKEYVVRGIVSAYAPMLIVRGNGVDYENLAFIPSDLSGGKAQVEAFLYRHGLSGAHVVVQSGMYAKLLFGLAFLPAELACLLAAALFIKAYWPRRRRAAGLGYLALAAGALLLLLAILTHTFYWPQIYLPTKCSDFAFWRELSTHWREEWKAMTLMTPLPKDIQFFQAARAIAFGVILTLTVEICLYRRIKSEGRVNRALTVVLLVGSAGLAALTALLLIAN